MNISSGNLGIGSSVIRSAVALGASFSALTLASTAFAQIDPAPRVQLTTARPYRVDIYLQSLDIQNPDSFDDYLVADVYLPDGTKFEAAPSEEGVGWAGFSVTARNATDTRVWVSAQERRWHDNGTIDYGAWSPWQLIVAMGRRDGTIRPWEAAMTPYNPRAFEAYYHSWCLDVSGASTAANTGLQLWQCIDGDKAQQWSIGPFHQVVSGLQSNLAMSVLNSNAAAGTRVVSTPYSLAANQQWLFDNVQILGPGDGCLDVAGGNTSLGTPVKLNDCEGNPSQEWTFNGFLDNSIRGLGGLCMTEIGTANGSSIAMEACRGSTSQEWQLLPGGALENYESGRCLDTPGWGQFNDVKMDIWDCTGATNQKYAVRGLMQDWTGQCLDLAGGNVGNGSPIITWPCNSRDQAQAWYYAP